MSTKLDIPDDLAEGVRLRAAEVSDREREKQAYFDLAGRLSDSSSDGERKRLKEELGRMTFGE